MLLLRLDLAVSMCDLQQHDPSLNVTPKSKIVHVQDKFQSLTPSLAG